MSGLIIPASLRTAKVYRAGLTRRQLRAFRRISGLSKPLKVAAWLQKERERLPLIPSTRPIYAPAD